MERLMEHTYGKFCTLIVGFLFSAGVVAADTRILFYVPSSVTTDSTRAYFELVQEFEQQNPGYQVELVATDSYVDVIERVLENTSQKRSSGVFIAEMSEVITLRNAAAIVSLDPFIAEESAAENHFLDSFLPAFLPNSYIGEELYSLPIFRSAPIIYFNLSLLDQHGIPTDTLPQSREALHQLLLAYRESAGKPGLLLANDWFDWVFEALVAQDGGSLYSPQGLPTFDSVPSVSSLEYWKLLIDQQLMVRSTRAWKSSLNQFVFRGNVPITYYSSAAMPFIEENAEFSWAATFIPHQSRQISVQGAGSIFMSSHLDPEQTAVAWKWIKFLTSTEAQVRLSLHSGYFPVVKTALNDPEIQQRYRREQYLNIVRNLDKLESKSMSRAYKQLRVILKDAIVDSLDNNTSPRVALHEAQNLALDVYRSDSDGPEPQLKLLKQ